MRVSKSKMQDWVRANWIAGSIVQWCVAHESVNRVVCFGCN